MNSKEYIIAETYLEYVSLEEILDEEDLSQEEALAVLIRYGFIDVPNWVRENASLLKEDYEYYDYDMGLGTGEEA